MDHYDLDYEMAIAFRQEILARLYRHIGKTAPDSTAPIPKQNKERDDNEGG